MPVLVLFGPKVEISLSAGVVHMTYILSLKNHTVQAPYVSALAIALKPAKFKIRVQSVFYSEKGGMWRCGAFRSQGGGHRDFFSSSIIV